MRGPRSRPVGEVRPGCPVPARDDDECVNRERQEAGHEHRTHPPGQLTSSRSRPPAPCSPPPPPRPSPSCAISTGFVFLWAFLDKTFGLGYATPAAKAWINGGSPTKGFLASVDVGPLQGFFHTIAGTRWANWLFMLGLLGIGVALIAGIGLRIAAVAGTLMMAMMWLAEFPLAQHTSAGEPTGSTNPITDYHFIYAVVAIVLAAHLRRAHLGPRPPLGQTALRPAEPLAHLNPHQTHQARGDPSAGFSASARLAPSAGPERACGSPSARRSRPLPRAVCPARATAGR